jgi:hypothetical protein
MLPVDLGGIDCGQWQVATRAFAVALGTLMRGIEFKDVARAICL